MPKFMFIPVRAPSDAASFKVASNCGSVTVSDTLSVCDLIGFGARVVKVEIALHFGTGYFEDGVYIDDFKHIGETPPKISNELNTG
jgi:hypothetical protein